MTRLCGIELILTYPVTPLWEVRLWCRTFVVWLSVCPQILWKGNALQPEANALSQQPSFTNTQENRDCQSCEPNNNSVGSDPVGLLPADENLVVKIKPYLGRSKWTSKSKQLLFLSIFIFSPLRRDFQPLCICLWPEVGFENVENCWNNHNFIAISPTVDLK